MSAQPTPDVSVVVPARDPGPRVRALVHEVLASAENCGVRVEIVIVDDGSAPPIDQPADRAVHIVRNPRPQGRAAARNVGARASRAGLLVFLDSDCVPVSREFLAAHQQVLARGAIASCGGVVGAGNRFWHEYQARSSRKRRRSVESGQPYLGTAANLMVARAAYIAVGGFDEAYVEYGFEDRDFLIRTAAIGSIGWAVGAEVAHDAALSLRQVATKMGEAAGSSAVIFATRHPGQYRELGYAALDSRLHRWLSPLVPVARLLVVPLAASFDWLVVRRLVPFSVGSVWVRLVSGLAYLCGSARGSPLQR